MRTKFVMLRPRIPIKKIYWEFHKGDHEFNPSLPHGHSLDGRYKLELWSGCIYEVSTGKVCGTAKSKDMERLFRHPGFQEFVIECRDEYEVLFPAVSLPPLSSNQGFYVCNVRKKHIRTRKIKDQYVFAIGYD